VPGLRIAQSVIDVELVWCSGLVTTAVSALPSPACRNFSKVARLQRYALYERRTPLGLPVVPDVKMTIRGASSVSDASAQNSDEGSSVIEASLSRRATSKISVAGSSDLILARTSVGVPASTTTSFESVTFTLWTTRSGVSACQLIVMGVVPSITDARRKARSPSVLSEKNCVWQLPCVRPARLSTVAALQPSDQNSPRVTVLSTIDLSAAIVQYVRNGWSAYSGAKAGM